MTNHLSCFLLLAQRFLFLVPPFSLRVLLVLAVCPGCFLFPCVFGILLELMPLNALELLILFLGQWAAGVFGFFLLVLFLFSNVCGACGFTLSRWAESDLTDPAGDLPHPLEGVTLGGTQSRELVSTPAFASACSRYQVSACLCLSCLPAVA